MTTMTELLQAPEIFYEPSLDELVRFAEEAGCYSDEPPELLAGGHHNVVCRYGNAVIKCPKPKEAGAALDAEFDFLRAAGGWRMPRAIARGEIAGTPVIVREFVEGKHRDFNALGKDEVEELVRAMLDLHGNTSDRFSDASGTAPTREGTHADYARAMADESVTRRLKMLAKDRHDLSVYPDALLVIEKGLEKFENLLRANPAEFSGRTFSLLHHDLNPQNVRWRPDGSVVFIDPNPTYGDPLDDVNYAITNNQGSAEFQGLLLSAYGRLSGQGKVSPARMLAYTLKNWLDDLAWTIEMQEKHPGDAGYADAYARRLAALDGLLRANER